LGHKDSIESVKTDMPCDFASFDRLETVNLTELLHEFMDGQNVHFVVMSHV